jgi:hypothetical protein
MSDDDEIVEFDTQKDHPHGFTRVSVHMTNEMYRDDKKPSWMPQYRPNIIVYAENRSLSMTSTQCFGLKNIDACLIHIGDTGIGASFCGYGAHPQIWADNVARVIGKRSKYNSAESDLNTGRLIIELKGDKR